jgi:hypothetical protein
VDSDSSLVRSRFLHRGHWYFPRQTYGQINLTMGTAIPRPGSPLLILIKFPAAELSVKRRYGLVVRVRQQVTVGAVRLVDVPVAERVARMLMKQEKTPNRPHSYLVDRAISLIMDICPGQWA